METPPSRHLCTKSTQGEHTRTDKPFGSVYTHTHTAHGQAQAVPAQTSTQSLGHSEVTPGCGEFRQ
jgi:hypothetical protein